MNSFIAELVVSGIYKKKYEFIASACMQININLLSFIELYKNLNKRDNTVRNSFTFEYDQWSRFFVDRNNIARMIESKELELNKDYIFYKENNIDVAIDSSPSKLLLSSIGVNKVLTSLSISSIIVIKNIAQQYKYYIDNLFYLNINVYNSDYIEEND